jgi:hypothetical protein
MAKKVSIAALVLLVVVVGLLALGNWSLRRRTEAVCQICQRHIHPGMRVVAEIGGRKRVACCAHCVLTEGSQENKPVRLVQVTDYTTGADIQAERAWYVEGSRLVACEHREFNVDEYKHVQIQVFDRCAPGTYAFARREDADAFVARNGGIVRTERELLAGSK